MQTFTHASHANAIVKKHGFPDGVVQLLCGIARANGSAKATATNDEFGKQLLVFWHKDPRTFSCELFDGRLSGGRQLERFNVR